jgi:hypothetical protein
MNEQPDHKPFSETDLESPQYRERLMRKLNCLIALLEVAMARVRRSLAEPEPDLERLNRIRTNLQSTLDVCLRARAALERREALTLPHPEGFSHLVEPGGEADALASLHDVIRPRRRRLPTGARIEMSSPTEMRKFERLGRIGPRDIARCDIEELTRRLQGS